MKELLNNDRLRVSSIIKNEQSELTIPCVLESLSHGKVFVDDPLFPQSFLIKTSECNLIGGSTLNKEFNDCVKNEIEYYDTILCDTDEWSDCITKIHPNIALMPYKRKYFNRKNDNKIVVPNSTVQVEYIYGKNIKNIIYKNREVILDWINNLNIADIQNVCLAALVIIEDQIVSCSCVDCYVDKRVEIGIKTIRGHEKNGYGFIATSSLINVLIDNGITDIGWHCMSTNIGSQMIAQKCGFKKMCEYPLFSPYPPIENVGDISMRDWYSLGEFYSEKGKIAIDQYWQAARCWAKAKEDYKVIECLTKLIDENQIWFLNYIDECEEFIDMQLKDEWKEIVKKAMTIGT